MFLSFASVAYVGDTWRQFSLGVSATTSREDRALFLTLLMLLTALILWTPWIATNQAIKNLKILKHVKILHRKRRAP